jgi:hypothetical protein
LQPAVRWNVFTVFNLILAVFGAAMLVLLAILLVARTAPGALVAFPPKRDGAGRRFADHGGHEIERRVSASS